MTNMKKVLLIIVLAVLSTEIAAQGSRFEFEAVSSGVGVYDFNMGISNVSDIQFIEVNFIEDIEFMEEAEIYILSLNKKKDNNYYLAVEENESRVEIENFSFSLSRKLLNDFQEEINDENNTEPTEEDSFEVSGLLTQEITVLIKLLDINMNILDSYQLLIY